MKASDNISVAYAYNHQYCKIERYLVNHGRPYSIIKSTESANGFDRVLYQNNSEEQ